MKRMLDILLAAAALILFLPLGLAIMLVLRLTGEGEVFYVQPRIGRGGRTFGLIKFATMLKNSPQLGTGTITVRNDPRVLPVGRFLRKTKLNEVPQLINVLKGDMSLVGPRPLMPPTFAYYSPAVQAAIAQVRPGLTGIGSIVFRDEESVLAHSGKPAAECYREHIAPHKGELEQWYIRHQSLRLDVKLILLTVVAVLFPRLRWHERALKGLPAPPPGLLPGAAIEAKEKPVIKTRQRAA